MLKKQTVVVVAFRIYCVWILKVFNFMDRWSQYQVVTSLTGLTTTMCSLPTAQAESSGYTGHSCTLAKKVFALCCSFWCTFECHVECVRQTCLPSILACPQPEGHSFSIRLQNTRTARGHESFTLRSQEAIIVKHDSHVVAHQWALFSELSTSK